MSIHKIISNQQYSETKLNHNYRKDYGVFLTSDINIINKIISIIDFEDDNLINRKILEPSCGNGVLIISILEKLYEQGLTFDDVSFFIEKSLYFNDVDDGMVNMTIINIKSFILSIYGIEYTGKFNSINCDFTLKMDDWFLNFFDYIIGNPPYVSLYGRRDRKKNEEQRVYYLENYNQFPPSLKNGKINFVMLFIEQSLNLLKQGSILSFIIDVAFFETAYKHIRKYLVENTQIIKLIFNITSFDVVSGQIIIQLKKSIDKNNKVFILDYISNKHILINQCLWDTPNDEYKYRFNMSEVNMNIMNKVNSSNHVTLKDVYPDKNLRTCTMLLDMEKEFTGNQDSKDGVQTYRYYRGSKSLNIKYGELSYDSYFYYDTTLKDNINIKLQHDLEIKGIKNKKRIGLGESVIYDNPKIYIRQSAKEIISAYDDSKSSSNNSLYVFSLRNNDINSIKFLKFLCGLLNSDFITFYAQEQNIIRYSKGKQPQIKISDLYKIPIITDGKIQNDIYNIVDSRVIDIDKINSIVYSYFNISDIEILAIEKSIRKFGSV